jgi:HEAT repeat protein
MLDVRTECNRYHLSSWKQMAISGREEIMKVKIEVLAENVDEAQMAEAELEHILSLVASNHDAPSDILNVMSKAKSTGVLMEVAENPNTDLETLEKLIEDKSPEVRASVAQHPNAITFMWKLATDPSPLVRYCLAMNPNFPEHIYQALAKDENYRVARRAKRTLAKIKEADSLIGNIAHFFVAKKAS